MAGALSLLLLPTAALAAPWTPVPVTLPTGAAGGLLHGVSCPAAGSCAAVGDYYTTAGDALRGKPMVATETGGTWEPATAIVPAGSEEQVVLESVSCVTVGTCVAVGVEGKIGLMPTHPIAVAETEGLWGQAIDVTPPGGATHSLLLGVSCPAAGTCVAVGGDEFGPFTVTDTDGSWGTAEQIAMPAGLTGPNFELPTVDLTGVSCAAVGSCVAVGEGWDTSGNNQSAIGATETDGHWGQAVVIAPPSPSSLPGNARTLLQGVSCAAGSCLAVGNNEGPGPFAVGNTGGAWGGSSAVPLPTGAAGGSLYGVSCPAGSCVAVGEAEIDGKGVPAVTGESGGSWTQVAVEPPAGASFADLTGVSCASAESCVAVGVSDPAAGEEVPLLYGGGAPAPAPPQPSGGGGSINVAAIAAPRGGTAPTCSLALKGTTIAVTRAHVAQVKLADTGSGACEGTASLSIAIKPGPGGKGAKAGRKKPTTKKIGSGSLRLSPGGSATVEVALNGAGKAALANGLGSLKATLTVEAGEAQIVRKVDLRGPKPKHAGPGTGPR